MSAIARTARTAFAVLGIFAGFLAVAPANAAVIGTPVKNPQQPIVTYHTVTVKLLTTDTATVDLQIDGAGGEGSFGGSITNVSAEYTNEGTLYTFTLSVLSNAKSVYVEVYGGPEWWNTATLPLSPYTLDLNLTLVPDDHIP